MLEFLNVCARSGNILQFIAVEIIFIHMIILKGYTWGGNILWFIVSIESYLIDMIVIAIYSFRSINYNVIGYANFMIRIICENKG